jgi:hypothetical protein
MTCRPVSLSAVLAVLTLGLAGGQAGAGHFHGLSYHHSAECPACIPGVHPDNGPDRGRGVVARKHPYRECEHTLARAGYPTCISPHAEPSYDENYNGYYVGGGVGFNHGCPPRWPQEGTFGWDYDGYGVRSHRVMMGWSRGRLFQSGYGNYETETPVEVPNVFAENPLEHFHKGHGEH